MDLTDPSILDGRTWRWFTTRLFGLSLESRTWQRLGAQMAEDKGEADLDEVDHLLGITRE